jgi:hypothetical protein
MLGQQETRAGFFDLVDAGVSDDEEEEESALVKKFKHWRCKQ